jgi:hypothetical protein
MSFGPFIESKYQTAGGSICAIRVQPETTQLEIGGILNGPPAGAIDSDRGVSASGKRSILHWTARRVGVRVTDGAGPYAQNTVHYIPVLEPTTYQSYVTPRGKTGTYNGSAVVVIGGSPERP